MLIYIKLSLYYKRKECLVVIINLLISYIIAYSLVKDILKQADVYKRLLKICKAKTK
jgi:hypothetical protein